MTGKLLIRSRRVLGILGGLTLMASFGFSASSPSAPASPASAAMGADPKTLLIGNSTLEEGKALYENGQYLAALSKFMAVLRRDPHDPEARKYLSLVVDEMRSGPGRTGGKDAAGAVVSPQQQEELRKLLKQRSLFTLDLKAIPGIKLEYTGGVAHLEMDSTMLFATGSGALKEQAIPLLDRTSAWLKTFGAQPIIIHLLPEENQDPQTNGNLFLSRYSELYNFFVEERKMPPQRFISADLLPHDTNSVAESSGTPRVVIETVGARTPLLDAMPAANPRHAISRWLEVSIEASKSIFNPEEGEWVNIDLAALTRTGLRSWDFKISPTKGGKPVFAVDGKGNVLKRLAWDGHNQATGSFAAPGRYFCQFRATDSDGKIMTREIAIQVAHTTDILLTSRVREKAATPKTKQKAKKKAVAPKTTSVAAPAASPAASASEPATTAEPTAQPAGSAASATDNSDTLIDDKAAASSAAPEAEDASDSVRAIWKQVIQFEPGEAELKPTLKASLERIGKTLEVYPLQKVRIMGFASSSEPNAAALAQKRAEAVQSILVEQYHVNPKRVLVAGGKVSASDSASKVEMSITN